jgi:uncharacterized membrane protein YeiH
MFQEMTVIQFIEYFGIFVFAMSGILAASEKQLDLFGGIIIAFVTALGGGTLRDLLLNINVSWVEQPIYIYLVLGGAAFALSFKRIARHIRKTIFLFDSVGISLFTILGVQKTLLLDLPVLIVIIFGVMTATFGGVIRDILCNEIPLIFRREIYATACVMGAVIYVLLHKIGCPELINIILSCCVIITIRTIAILKKWSLPAINIKI